MTFSSWEECLNFSGAGAGAEAGEKNTRSRSKMYRLRNTAREARLVANGTKRESQERIKQCCGNDF